MKSSIAHLIPTDRDRLIMKILASLSLATSKTLRRISSPQTKYKTFLWRLSALKTHGFVKELYGNERLRNHHGIYALWNISIVSVSFPEIGNPKPIPSKSSRSIFKHRLLLGDFVADTLDTVIRKNNPSIVPTSSEIRWSDYIQSEITKWQKTPEYMNISSLPIPDFILTKGNRLFAFELQNQSNNHQLQNKVSNYQFLRIQRNAEWMFPLFKGKETILAVALRDAKKLSAQHIINEYKWKKFIKSIEDFK